MAAAWRPQHRRRTDAARQRDPRRHRREPSRGWCILVWPRRSAQDVRRSSRYSHRERAAIQRDEGGAREADATSEILSVVSSSPADIQPVLTAVAEGAAQLCQAYDVTVFRVEDDVLRLVAHHGPVPATPQLGLPIVRDTVGGRSILEARTIQVADLQVDDGEYPLATSYARKFGHRTLVSVPLLRDGVAIGAIQLRRTEVAPFTDTQIALLQTFADQAVIAIENVRLFTELQHRNRDLTDALEQQTATAEILRSISGSPTDIRPVLEAVVHAAARFCDAPDVAIVRVDGDVLRGAAAIGPFGEEMIRRAGSVEAVEFPISRESVTGRAVVERRSVHVHDLAMEREDEYPVGLELQRRDGHRTLLATPLLREGVPVGAIIMFRTEANPFSDKQVRLSQTFADQAVIAIENVRLFTELQARNRDLTEALEQQTATSEILQVISRSPTDVRPVFDAIAANAARLCGATDAIIRRVDGNELTLVAHYGALPGIGQDVRMSLSRGSIMGRAVMDSQAIHVHDLTAVDEGEYPFGRALAQRFGYRTALAMPLLREGRAIGSIGVRRMEVRPFTDQQIKLLQTFADQAVIAIENVRLFTELGERNRELTDSLTQQTATAEILRVISSSPTDIQPVMDVVAESAARFCSASDASIGRVEGEVLRRWGSH